MRVWAGTESTEHRFDSRCWMECVRLTVKQHTIEFYSLNLVCARTRQKSKYMENRFKTLLVEKSWKFFPYPSLRSLPSFFTAILYRWRFFLLRRVIKLLLEKITMKQSTISSWGFLILSAAFWVVRHTAWTKQFLQMKQHDFQKRPTNALIEDYKKIYKKERYEKEGKKHSDFFRLFRNLTSGLWTTVCCSIPFTPRLKINVTRSIQKLLFRFRCRFCGCILKWWRLSTQ